MWGENGARGWIILEHLKLWREWNQDPSHPLYQRVDMQNIALIGMSRGGEAVAHAHLTYLNPFPANLGKILMNYRKVLVPELNMGQLRTLIRSRYLVDAVGFNKVKGKPFTVSEVVFAIEEFLAEMS